MSTAEDAWVTESCTLPTAERPLRVADFDGLFASALRSSRRLGPTRLSLVLDRRFESRARELASKETACCSFFAFEFRSERDSEVVMDVAVPAEYVDVLNGFATRLPIQDRGERGWE